MPDKETPEESIVPSERKSSRKKVGAVLLFLLAFLFWIATVINHTLGFVAPVNGESLGFDLWTALMWAFFAYAAVHLYRTFRTPTQSKRET